MTKGYLWILGVLFLLALLLPFTALQAQSASYAVEFADTAVAARQGVVVNWQAPSNRTTKKDWVGLFVVGADDRRYVAWRYIPDGVSSGAITFAGQPAGTYEARMFSDSGYTLLVKSSNNLTVGGAVTTPPPSDGGGTPPVTGNYSVSVTNTTITLGQSITVNYSAPSGIDNKKDWIGLYLNNAPDRNYETWARAGQTTGTVTFTPRKVGTYVVRYYPNNGYESRAVSTSVVVQAAGGNGGDSNNGGNNGGDGDIPTTGNYSVSVPSQNFALRENITVSYTTPSPRTSTRNWIGIYAVGANDRTYVTYKFIPDNNTSGNLTFSITKAGTYEARIFSNTGYDKAATSNNTFTVGGSGTNPPDGGGGDGGGNTGVYNLTVSTTAVAVGESVTVSYVAPSSANRNQDWIGMYLTNAGDRQASAWQYIGSGNTGSITFTPTTAGTYEFRYFKNNVYTKVATSPAVVVTATEIGGQCVLSESSLRNITNYPAGNGPVVAFGDSLTAGVGATSGQDYVSHLSRKSGAAIINAGISGNTTRDAMARLDRDVLARNPSVVLLWLGGNDILQRHYERVFELGQNPGLIESLRLIIMRITGKLPAPQGIGEAETFANLTTLIERIQANGSVVVVIGFSGGIFDSSLEGQYRAVAQATNSIYVPNALGGVMGRSSLMGDLVHPNGAGYAIVADRVLPYFACVAP